MKTVIMRKMVLLGILGIFLMGVPVHAQDTGDGYGQGGGQMQSRGPHGGGSQRGKQGGQEAKMQGMMSELGLTPEQQEALKAQRKAKRERMKYMRETLHAKRLELREELEKTDSDQAKIDSIASELKDIMSQQVERRIQDIMEVKAILTPEQFEQFKNKLRAFEDQKKGSRGMKHGGGQKGHGGGQRGGMQSGRMNGPQGGTGTPNTYQEQEVE